MNILMEAMINKKKYIWISLVLVVLIVATVIALNQEKGTEVQLNDDEEIKEIFIYQYKPEVAKEVEALAAAYELEHPNVKIDIQTNAGRDYMAMLGSVFASGREPDIFNVGGYEEMERWQDYLVDLSGEDFMSYMKPGTLEPITTSEGVFGVPYNIEGYGILYNEEIFADAGITEIPRNLDELIGVCARLEARGILPFYNSHAEWWTISIHSFNVLLAAHENPKQYVEDIAAGKRSFGDDDYFDRWLLYLDTMTDFGQENPFTSDYSSQVQAFANGEAAMIQQGNWIDAMLYQLNPELKVGIIPIPIEEDNNHKIQVGVPGYWCVNKHSAVKEEAIEFLKWMVESEAGRKFIVEDVAFIPSYTTIDDYDYREICAEVITYYNAGNTYGWYWPQLPLGFTNTLQDHIMSYLKDEITRDQLVEKMDGDLR